MSHTQSQMLFTLSRHVSKQNSILFFYYPFWACMRYESNFLSLFFVHAAIQMIALICDPCMLSAWEHIHPYLEQKTMYVSMRLSHKKNTFLSLPKSNVTIFDFVCKSTYACSVKKEEKQFFIASYLCVCISNRSYWVKMLEYIFIKEYNIFNGHQTLQVFFILKFAFPFFFLLSTDLIVSSAYTEISE